jgi:hypothetical protein
MPIDRKLHLTIPQQQDVVSPEVVEISFSANGRTMWVNIDGVNYLRITNAKTLKLDNVNYPRITGSFLKKMWTRPLG